MWGGVKSVGLQRIETHDPAGIQAVLVTLPRSLHTTSPPHFLTLSFPWATVAPWASPTTLLCMAASGLGAPCDHPPHKFPIVRHFSTALSPLLRAQPACLLASPHPCPHTSVLCRGPIHPRGAPQDCEAHSLQFFVVRRGRWTTSTRRCLHGRGRSRPWRVLHPNQAASPAACAA